MEYKICDLMNINRGASPRPIIEYLTDNGYRWLKISDFSLGDRYVYKTKEYIKEEGITKTKFLKKGTLILTNSATPGIPIFLGEDMCLHDGFLYFQNIKEEIISKEYLYYWFIFNRNNIVNQANGSVFKNLKKEIVMNLSISLPSLNTQKKVVKILDSITRKIETNNQTNDNLYEITNKLYEQLFVIERQDDWKEYNLQELMDISNGYSYTGKELVDTSVVGMATIKNFERTGGFKEEGFKDIEPIKAKDIHYADKFDILVACTDLTQNADIIGNAIMLLNIGKYEKVLISMDLVKILPKKNKYLVFSILNSKEFKNFALGYKTGTTVLHLNKNCFKDFHIKLPDFDKIENFEKVVETNYKKISYNLEKNNTLTQLRNTLLPKLMNGEIDLDKIEI